MSKMIRLRVSKKFAHWADRERVIWGVVANAEIVDLVYWYE